MAAHVYASDKGQQYGPSVTAIERHLRRLSDARARRAVESEEFYRRWRESYKAATGREPEPTLMEVAVADKK